MGSCGDGGNARIRAGCWRVKAAGGRANPEDFARTGLSEAGRPVPVEPRLVLPVDRDGDVSRKGFESPRPAGEAALADDGVRGLRKQVGNDAMAARDVAAVDAKLH